LQSVAYVLRAPVQADQTGPSIAAMRSQVADYLGPKPMTEAEFARAVTGGIRALPGSFESSLSVLAAMQQNDLLGRPDDYYSTIAHAYEALTLPQVGQAIRSVIVPGQTTWIVVGDARTVRPQLDSLGLPVEVVPVASVTGRPASAAATDVRRQ
jgi:predicted Zn-dependent peptidase